MVPGISMPEVPTSLTALMVPGISMPEGVPCHTCASAKNPEGKNHKFLRTEGENSDELNYLKQVVGVGELQMYSTKLN